LPTKPRPSISHCVDTNAFTQTLLKWFLANGRKLPWRQLYDPYQVWISEIMAQQTQMGRVVPYFERWMGSYPDLESLAEAEEDDVLKLWEGLGYYSRARNILKAAKTIRERFNGEFPSSAEDISSLPGIGEYTTGAISSIAFNAPNVCIDANVKRVFARLLNMDLPFNAPAFHDRVKGEAEALLPEGHAREFNQALMELGQLVCMKKPVCDMCPVQSFCLSLKRGVVDQRPVPASPREVVKVDVATGVLFHEGRVLIQKRRPDDVWPGLWEFPGGVIEEGEKPEDTVVREYLEEVELTVEPVEKITVVKYSYTKYRVTLHCYQCTSLVSAPSPVFHEAVEGCFVQPQQLGQYAFPSGHRKLMEHMRGDLRYSQYNF